VVYTNMFLDMYLIRQLTLFLTVATYKPLRRIFTNQAPNYVLDAWNG